MINPDGSFTEFTDLVVGLYTTVLPSDEPWTLEWLGVGNGWSLSELSGSVTLFGADGRWLETADRHGNTTIGTYDGSGALTLVELPDKRTFVLDYDGSGKLASIIEVGVDGSTTRKWEYQWSGHQLSSILRPDGSAWELEYSPTTLPLLIRQRLVPSGGGTPRVERAWEYDSNRVLLRTWKGAESFGSPDAIDRYELTHPEEGVTVVTDPLGGETVYVWDREPGSGAPRLLSTSGDCPSCGPPNRELFYEDSNHPLRPTRIVEEPGTADERITLFTYDDVQGQTTSRTEASGAPGERTTIWEYHSTFPALPTLEERPSTSGTGSRKAIMDYDASGNMELRTIEGTEAGPAFAYTTAMTYNAAGQVLTVDPPGFGSDDVTTWTYDLTRGDLVPLSRQDPLLPAPTTFGYDPFNRRTQVTDPNGATTETHYDDLDRVIQVVQHGDGIGGSPTEGDLVTDHLYDAYGDLVVTVLPRGNVVEYGYDAAGRLEMVARGPEPGTLLERTLYTLDAAGNRTREELQRFDSGTSAWVADSVAEYVYSTRCHLDRMILAPGTPEEAVTEYAYDCHGNLERVWDANNPSNGQTNPPSLDYAYDELDRLVSVTQPWGGSGGGTVVTTYGYDVQDHLTSVTDGEGNQTTFVYSDRDLMTQEDSPVSGVTTFAYNEHGELTSRTDARLVTESRTVDALGRVTTVSYPDPSLDVAYHYDDSPGCFSLGRLTAIDRHGETLEHCYDRFGRLVTDGALAYDYDPNGNPVAITYPNDVVAVYGYDFADRQSSLAVDTGSGPQSVVESAAYLATGNLASLALASGITEERSFDLKGHPTAIAAVSPTRDWDWNPTTDFVGNVTAITTTRCSDLELSHTVTTTETFTACHDILAGSGFTAATGSEVTLTAGRRVVLSDGFVVESGAIFVAGVDPALAENPTVETRTFAYQESQYFLTCAAGPWSPGASCAPPSGDPDTWSYDRIGNRLTETLDGVTDTYTYETNATSGNTSRLSSISGSTFGLRTYTFDVAGHLTEVERGANVIELTVGADGRLLGAARPAGSEAATFTYDGRSFLGQATNQITDEAVTAVYSSQGILMAVLEANMTSSALSGPSALAVAWSDTLFSQGSASGPPVIDFPGPPSRPTEGSQQRPWQPGGATASATSTPPPPGRYVFYLAGRPVAILSSDGTSDALVYLTTDHLGAPFLATDWEGREVWHGAFEPFGRDWQAGTSSGASENGVFLRFSGQWMDNTWEDATLGAEIYYNVHRWLLPGLGRYNRPDPLGLNLQGSFSTWLGPGQLFSYAEGRPTILIDPLGLEVYVCSAPVDLPFIGKLGIPHKWIKTDTKEAGLGPQGGGVPGEVAPACDNSCPYIAKTEIVDHTGRSNDPKAKCRLVRGVDEECVNRALEVGQAQGPWSFGTNDCWAFIDRVIERCRDKKPCFRLVNGVPYPMPCPAFAPGSA